MASLFKPDVPQQNPAVAKQQQDEQMRAEAARTKATQEQLRTESIVRLRTTGKGFRSLLGTFGSGGSTLGSN